MDYQQTTPPRGGDSSAKSIIVVLGVIIVVLALLYFTKAPAPTENGETGTSTAQTQTPAQTTKTTTTKTTTSSGTKTTPSGTSGTSASNIPTVTPQVTGVSTSGWNVYYVGQLSFNAPTGVKVNNSLDSGYKRIDLAFSSLNMYVAEVNPATYHFDDALNSHSYVYAHGAGTWTDTSGGAPTDVCSNGQTIASGIDIVDFVARSGAWDVNERVITTTDGRMYVIGVKNGITSAGTVDPTTSATMNAIINSTALHGATAKDFSCTFTCTSNICPVE
jgi:hypothetical protein